MSGRHHRFVRQSLIVVAIVVGLVAIGSLLRVASIYQRPIHHDEISAQMIATGIWRLGMLNYEPEFHGPVIFYCIAAAQKIFGESEVRVRIMHVMFSVLTIIIIVAFVHDGRKPWLVALLALSPTLVYYSGYAYFESLWVLLYCVWLLSVERIFFEDEYHWSWLYILVLTTILMHGAHEFSYVVFALTAVFIAGKYVFDRVTYRRKHSSDHVPNHIVPLFIIGIIVFCAVWSSGFQNIPGISKDAVRSVTYNLHKSTTASGHDKPFHYYWKLTGVLEWMIAILVIAGILLNRNARDFFMAFLGLGSLVILSITRYKTPWGMVLFLPPLIFFGASAMGRVAAWPRGRHIAAILVVLLALWGAEAFYIGILYPVESEKNPLAYVQSSKDIWKVKALVDRIVPSKVLISGEEQQVLSWLCREYSPTILRNASLGPETLAEYDVIFSDLKKLQNGEESGFTSLKFSIRPGLKQAIHYRDMMLR